MYYRTNVLIQPWISDVDLHKNYVTSNYYRSIPDSTDAEKQYQQLYYEGVLVDCGIRSSYTTIKKVIQKIAVHQHVLTHAHADHQGAVIRYAQSSTFPYYVIPTKFSGPKQVW